MKALLSLSWKRLQDKRKAKKDVKVSEGIL